MIKWVIVIFVLCLTGCADRDTLAPVVESRWHAYNRNATQYVVHRGDTLYSIAFRYDQDYRQLAVANRLRSPYTLSIGQIIHLQPMRRISRSAAPSRSITKPIYTPRRTPWSGFYNRRRWLWPAQGRIVSSFVPTQGKKGIEIAGHKGDKIYASKAGVVAYAGNGLSGYGNLIIIKHDNQFLTAYGDNARNLVREGQSIKAGQVIAEMGIVNRRFYGVHFEIRQAGHPVNPLSYL
ncbi:MAG: peptidoglycan DD-metalloendopeptidase family protein [Legionellaceae bacterium]|nr:peptidoglycan DD-metalloendopeptidase family protein [Legionellaceae bacterium]